MSQNLETSITINANVDGLDKFEQLRKQLEQSGVDTSELSNEFNQLAQSFAQAQQQQGLIDTFRQLKKATDEAKEKMESSQQATNALAREWKQAERQAKTLVESIKQHGKVLSDEQKALEQAKKQSAQLSEERKNTQQYVKALTQAIKEKNDVSDEERLDLELAKKHLANLNEQYQTSQQQIKQFTQSIKEKNQALKDNHAQLKATEKNAKDLQQQFQTSSKESKKLQSDYEQLNVKLHNVRKSMSEAGVSTKNFAEQQRELKQQTEQAQQGLSNLTEKTKQLQQQQTAELQQLNAEAERLKRLTEAKATLGIDTDDNARQELQRITQAYETLRRSGTLSQAELARATERHTQRVQELEQQLGRTRPTLEDLTAEFGKLTAAAGGLTYVTKMAMEFETAMSGVKKVVDGTPEQLQAIAEQIKQLSVQLGMSSKDVAQITALGGQLGVPIEQLGKFTEMAGKMSVAFNMTAEQAGTAAAKLANVFGVPITQVEALGDAINTLGNNTAAKESEIVETMVRIGGTAKQFGLAEEQAAALASAMISLGQAPDVAATGINALLTKLQTAQMQSDDFKNALKQIGLTADDMAKQIQANPQQALTLFLEKLSKLDKQQQAMVNFKLFGQEYVDDISLLTGSLKTYQQALGLVADKQKTAGAMSKEFEAKMATTAAEIEKAKASLQVLAQTVGSTILPLITDIAKGFTSVSDSVNEFAKAFPIITQFAILLTSAKVASIALSSSLKMLGVSFAPVTAGAIASSTAMTALNTAMMGVLKGVASFTAGFMLGDYLYKEFESVRMAGDFLAQGLAYIDAMLTERTFDDVRQNFKTSAEVANELAEAQKNVKKASDEQTQAQQKTADATKQLAESHRKLYEDIKVSEINLTLLNAQLSKMRLAGEVDTSAFKKLQQEIQQTEEKLKFLKHQAESQGLGEALKNDFQKAQVAFDAIGLDIEEFRTGINSKATTALDAFVKISDLAKGNVVQLARAYNATKDSIGDNAKAQEMLNQKLLEVSNGNKQLADSIRLTAQAQREAKSTTEAQIQALEKLGISMDAVNAKMSKSGHEMVSTLRHGIKAIQEQATSAEAVKTAITQALDVSLQSAKTQEDFRAINQVLQETGTQSQITAQQMQTLNLGMQGGIDKITQATQEANQSLNSLERQSNSTSNTIRTTMFTASQSVDSLVQSTGDAVTGFDEMGNSAEQAGQRIENAMNQELGGKLGTTTNSYYNLEAIANELKNKGYDDTQALAKAREVFQKASQQMMNWAGTDSTLRNLAKNRIERHGVTAEAMYQAMKQASEQALELKAQKARQEQQLQQLQQTLQQLQSTPTNTVNVGDFSTALNDVIAKAQAQGGQQVMQQLLQEMKRKPR